MKPVTSLEEWCIKNDHEDILQNYNRGNNSVPASKIGKATRAKVWWKCENPKHSPWLASVAAVTWKCSGCPTCSNRRIEPGVNDILTLFPNVCKDWDYDKNSGIDIRLTSPGSNQKIWWRCSKCGKKWRQSPSKKINTKRSDIAGCAKCRIVEMTNINENLEDWCVRNRKPEILREYNRGRNELPASKVGKCSGKHVKWVCAKGHAWEAPPNNRTNPKKVRGCPVCGRKKLVPGVNDFGTLFPDIAKEWDYEKNYPKTPADVFPGNNTTWYWWKCSNGHSYRTKLNNKTSAANRSGCPYCQNDKVLTGFNDLETWCKQNNFEILIKEYSPNNRHKINEILYGHDGKVEWICSVCGCRYYSNVYYRTKGTGCPKCNKVNRSSFPEQAIFYYLKKIFPGAKNGYTKIFNNKMELDIYIPSIKVGIEYDGIAWHSREKMRDREREKYRLCKEAGIKLIRVREERANEKLDDICDDYLFTDFTNRNYIELDQKKKKIITSLSARTLDVDCERDLPVILSGFIYKKVKNSLAEKYPEIAKDWDYEKNGELTPDMVSAHSGQKVWWKCKNKHPSYKKAVYVRVNQKYGCPYCVGRKALKGVNDLATLKPDIAKEWDYEKNYPLKPEDVMSNSNKQVWWKCSRCGEEWMTAPYHRKNANCKKCNHTKRVIKA